MSSAPRPLSSRLRTLLIVPMLVVVGVAATGQPGLAADPSGERVAHPGNDVPPLPEVQSVVTLANGPRYETAKDGTLYSPLDEPDFIRGHDNGQSTLYDNGKGLRFSYWSFGDTFLTRPNGDGDSFLANTGAGTTDLDMGDSISDWDYDGGEGGPREFIDLNAEEQAWNDEHADTDPDADGCQPGPGVTWMACGDEYAIWGGSIVADPDRKRILAFYALITRYHALKAGCTQDDIDNRNEACREWLFDGVGTGVAVWTEGKKDGNGWARQTVAHPTDPDIPTAIWPTDGVPSTPDARYDTAMVVDHGYLYAYGCYGFLASECRLARVPLSPAEAVWDRASWRFFAGDDRDRARCRHLWSADLECAVPLPAGTKPDGTPDTLSGGAAGTSVYWNPRLRVFMSIYSVPLSNDIHYRVAYRPEGPWSQAKLLGVALPAVGEGLGSISYAGFVHPEYAERGGLVQYITYAHTSGFLKSDFPVMKVTFADPRGH
ncbi:DUF4185 domain-containing protein [Actinopolymorpha sp. B9G3]|uniref:DUF4185 domain-containing protein n=1 Tax=Actinopolymorpha sp. B9G3 TaxID=3158970 RepID=UPI0032D96B7B